MRFLELRRHADNDGDALTDAGKTTAERVGRSMEGPFDAVFTSPAKRAATTAAWFLRGLGQQLPQLHGVTDGLTSPLEERWREVGGRTGTWRVDDIAREDPELIREELPRLADALLQAFAAIQDGQRALVVGHSPFLEAAVHALTGTVLEPLGKCEGALLGHDGERVSLVREARLEG